MATKDDAFKMSDEMLDAVSGILSKLPAIFSEIAKSETIVKSVARIIDKTNKDTKDTLSKADKTSSKIARTATQVYRNFQIDKLVSGAERIGDVFLSSAKSLQKYTSATFNEWSSFYYDVITATKELNSSIGKASINSAELLEAANKLASIGFKGLNDSLSQAAKAVALISRTVGTTTSSFNKSVVEMQKIFKEGTANLLTGLGDSLAAYNSVFGVTTEKLQDASAFLSSSLTKISKGNAAVMRAVTQDLFKAVSIAESMGIDSQAISSIMFDAMNMSYGKFATQYAGALASIGVNAQEFQKMIQSGDMSGAVTQLISAIQSKMGDMSVNQQNIWKEMLSSMGLKPDTINAILNNTSNLDEIVAQLSSIGDTTGAMQTAIGNQALSIGERFMNALSSNQFLGSLQNALSAMGIGSVRDASLVAANTLSIATGLKDSGILNALKSGKDAGGIAKLLSPIARIFQGSLPQVLGKLALAAGIFLLIAKTVTKVIDKLKANESFQEAVKMLKQAVSVILDVIMEIVDGLADVISEVIVKLVEVVTKIVTALKPVFDVVKEIVTMLLPIIQQIFTTLIDIVDNLIDPLVNLITTIVNVIKEILTVLVPVINTLMKVITKVIALVMDVLSVIIKVVGKILNIIANVISRVIELIAGIIDRVMPIINMIVEVVDTIFEAISPLLDAIMELIDSIFEALGPIIEVILDVIVQLLEPLANVLKTVLNVLGPLLKPLVSIIKLFAKVFQLIAPVIKFVANIISAIVGGLQAIGNWLADISIFGWHPFEFLRSNTSAPEIPEIEEPKNINNATSQVEFDTTSAGGMTYGFGMTGKGFHVGTDIPMASGTPLSAAQAGVITAAGFNSTYGNYASLLGSDGIQRVFGHLSSLAVGRGDRVMPGQTIGSSGNTGDSALPHLHYETRENGTFVDPYIIAQRGGNNADVVHAIAVMTERLERKLEEVSQETEDNSQWIANFEREQRLKTKPGY